MKLIIVSKKIYPINNRSKNCPIPPGILQTFEFKRTIKQLKGEINNKSSINPERLIFAGKELQNNKDLNYYNIQKECTIFMVFKQLGG